MTSSTSKHSPQQQQLLRNYGPWALITGASSGIGQAIAEQLAQAGFHLCLVGRNQEALTKIRSQWQSQYAIEIQLISIDLADPAQQKQLLDQLQELPIGLLVASAGFGSSGDFLDAPLDEQLAMIEVNCKAVVHLCHGIGQQMRKRKQGGIVLMSSLVAFQGAAGAANYAATKAFIQTFAEGLGIELAVDGIDVLASAPGPVHTGFANRAAMHMERAASPQEIAKETLFKLGKRRTVFPSLLAKGLGISLQFAPRWLRIRIMSQAMRKMAIPSS